MSAEVLVRTNDPPRFRPIARLRELWAHREVLANLARRELKAKYKSTTLGVAWSMLKPALYLLVFYVVFTYFLPTGVADFPVYLLSGLVPWTLFSNGFQAATTSVVGSTSLVTKVAFPHETLPLAAIRAETVNFFYQFLVLIAFMLVFGYPMLHRGTVLLPVALVVLLTFTAAIGFATAAWNVRYRDTGHLVELLILAWFWATPIVYPASLVRENLGPVGFQIYLLNPVTNIVLSFHRALYGGVSFQALADLPAPGVRWYGFRLLAVWAVSLGVLFLTWRLFYRRSGDFAEEL
jgi:ABC-2 type transport system permease protein